MKNINNSIAELTATVFEQMGHSRNPSLLGCPAWICQELASWWKCMRAHTLRLFFKNAMAKVTSYPLIMHKNVPDYTCQLHVKKLYDNH